MALVEINWRPTSRELRKFGLAMIVGFSLLALIFEFVVHERLAVLVCLGVGGVAGSLGLTGTKLAIPVYVLWMGLAFVMGNIVSRVLVTVFYFGVITPYACVMRVIGRDRLQLRNNNDSYWNDMAQPKGIDSYERQF